MKNKNPRTDKTVFEFKVNQEESIIYEIDYDALVHITNRVFDWGYIDEVISEIVRNEPTEDSAVEYYIGFFLELIKDARDQFGNFTFDEENLKRRLEIKAHLDMYAKKLS
jgi:hypothetical protein